jgi:hypothetical protein
MIRRAELYSVEEHTVIKNLTDMMIICPQHGTIMTKNDDEDSLNRVGYLHMLAAMIFEGFLYEIMPKCPVLLGLMESKNVIGLAPLDAAVEYARETVVERMEMRHSGTDNADGTGGRKLHSH